MISANKRRAWRLLYAGCCLVYIGWVGYQGSFDFNRVLREYQRAVDQVEPGRVRTAALEELVAECRKKSEMHAGPENTAENKLPGILIEDGGALEGNCLSFPSAQIEARAGEIRKGLLDRQKRAGWKLLLFTLFFVVIFLLIPPVIVYVFAVLFVKLFQGVKIVRNE